MNPQPAPTALAGRLDTTVVIPVKVPHSGYLRGLPECFREWFDRFAGVRVLVVDDSEPGVFERNAELWQGLPVEHLSTPEDCRTGTNNKSNAIQFGLERVATRYALLMDDDLRPSAGTLGRLRRRLEQDPLVRCRVYCADRAWYESLNLCEQYLGRVFDEKWQPFGHVAMQMAAFRAAGAFDRNVLFDDLEIERHCEARGLALAVADDIFIPMVSHGFKHFCGQRLIYAYETLAFPFMFRFLASILPIAGVLGLVSAAAALGWLAFVMLSCWISALVGWSRMRNEHLAWHTTLGAFPLVLSYSVMVWIAWYRQRAGGVWFGGGWQRFVPGEVRPASIVRAPRRREARP